MGNAEKLKPLTITVNVPDHELTGNARIGYLQKNRLFQEYKRDCLLLARHAMGKVRFNGRITNKANPWFAGPCRVEITWFRPPHGNQYDNENALIGLKACFDGFTAAHIWTDDLGNEYMPIQWGRASKRPPGWPAGCCVITVEPLSEPTKEN